MMSLEFFDKFAIERVNRQTPDGQVISVWNIGQKLPSGDIKWSNDGHGGKSREDAISRGKMLFG